jgi:hypothetical protein
MVLVDSSRGGCDGGRGEPSVGRPCDLGHEREHVVAPEGKLRKPSLCSLGTVSTASFSHEALSAAGASQGVVRRRGACCVSDFPSVNVTFTACSHRHARELQREELDPRVEPQER